MPVKPTKSTAPLINAMTEGEELIRRTFTKYPVIQVGVQTRFGDNIHKSLVCNSCSKRPQLRFGMAFDCFWQEGFGLAKFGENLGCLGQLCRER